MAVATAFPSDMEQTVEGNYRPNVMAPRPAQPNGVPHPGPVAVSDEANKEGLENAETFGFGYYHHYPRYYYGGYGGYGYYPRYYYGYPQYYW